MLELSFDICYWSLLHPEWRGFLSFFWVDSRGGQGSCLLVFWKYDDLRKGPSIWTWERWKKATKRPKGITEFFYKGKMSQCIQCVSFNRQRLGKCEEFFLRNSYMTWRPGFYLTVIELWNLSHHAVLVNLSCYHDRNCLVSQIDVIAFTLSCEA